MIFDKWLELVQIKPSKCPGLIHFLLLKCHNFQREQCCVPRQRFLFSSISKGADHRSSETVLQPKQPYQRVMSRRSLGLESQAPHNGILSAALCPHSRLVERQIEPLNNRKVLLFIKSFPQQ